MFLVKKEDFRVKIPIPRYDSALFHFSHYPLQYSWKNPRRNLFFNKILTIFEDNTNPNFLRLCEDYPYKKHVFDGMGQSSVGLMKIKEVNVV